MVLSCFGTLNFTVNFLLKSTLFNLTLNLPVQVDNGKLVLYQVPFLKNTLLIKDAILVTIRWPFMMVTPIHREYLEYIVEILFPLVISLPAIMSSSSFDQMGVLQNLDLKLNMAHTVSKMIELHIFQARFGFLALNLIKKKLCCLLYFEN